jgi:hypothetical protein
MHTVDNANTVDTVDTADTVDNRHCEHCRHCHKERQTLQQLKFCIVIQVNFALRPANKTVSTATTFIAEVR